MDGIVVGVDRSDGARAALRWALQDGDRRGVPVTAVHCLSPVSLASATIGLAGEDRLVYELRIEAEMLVADLVKEVQAEGYSCPAGVRTDVAEGLPAAALAAAARGADQVVVGSRGAGGFSRLLLGSVSDQVVRHAPVTVTVVRGDSVRTDGPVVVGVDGSRQSDRALRRAADEASSRGVRLHVVHTRLPVRLDPGPSVSSPNPDPVQRIEQAALRLVEDEVLRVLGPTPPVEVDTQVVVGSPAAALLEASQDAQLLVLGRRGHGGFSGLLLGSVSTQCVHHAPCPVTVVHDE